uniref:Uncharacterized protein MANES_13G107200 n=1 Tax=Rhizophora mucronata TaxID=61149 RepID=A0A2P2QUI3_RHIMU
MKTTSTTLWPFRCCVAFGNFIEHPAGVSREVKKYKSRQKRRMTSRKKVPTPWYISERTSKATGDPTEGGRWSMSLDLVAVERQVVLGFEASIARHCLITQFGDCLI